MPERLRKWAAARPWFDPVLARNTATMMAGFVLKLAVQAVYFVVIARGLGVDRYGAFIAIVAIVAVAAPFASFGTGNLLVRAVAHDRSAFALSWGRALVVTGGSASILLLAITASASLFMPHSVPLPAVIAVAVSDLLFARLLDVCGQAYQAFETLRRTAQFQLALTVARLIGALLLLAHAEHPTVKSWAMIYLMSTAVVAIIAAALTCKELGMPRFNRRSFPFADGLNFSLSLASQNVYNDIDKSMLARLSSVQAAGIYAAAYKLVDVAFSPVRALFYATYPRFFEHGRSGIHGAIAFSRKLLPLACGYGLITAIVLFLGGPLLPRILGPGYAASATVLAILAILPLLRILHSFAADTLTGAGHQASRSVAQLGVCVLNVLLNLWLIPVGGWRAAAWISVGSDGLLVVALWTLVFRQAAKAALPWPVSIEAEGLAA
jgi:O-antigen/teichoic acid export membrane protein